MKIGLRATITGGLLVALVGAFGCMKAQDSSKQSLLPKTVDVRTFLEAFHAGKVKQYEGWTVEGSGLNVYAFEKRKGEALWICPLAATGTGKIEDLKTMGDYLRAQMQGKRLLGVELRCKPIKPPPRFEDEVAFTGRFEGEMASITRMVSPTPPSVPGEDPAPVLGDCSVTVTRPATSKQGTR